MPVVAAIWTKLKVLVNADATLVSYYINDIFVGTNTLNIPTGAGRNVCPMMTIFKSVGITSRFYTLDWIWYYKI